MAVTKDEIYRCAEKYFPDNNPVIVAVGPAMEIQDKLNEFGSIEIHPYNVSISNNPE